MCGVQVVNAMEKVWVTSCVCGKANIVWVQKPSTMTTSELLSQHNGKASTETFSKAMGLLRHQPSLIGFSPWAGVDWMRKGRNKIHVARHIDPLQRSSNIVPSRPEWPTSTRRAGVWFPARLLETPARLSCCSPVGPSVSRCPSERTKQSAQSADSYCCWNSVRVCLFYSSSSLHFYRLGVIFRMMFPTEHPRRDQVWVSVSLSAPVITNGSHTFTLLTFSSFLLPFSFADQTSAAYSDSKAKSRLSPPVFPVFSVEKLQKGSHGHTPVKFLFTALRQGRQISLIEVT